MSNREDRTPLSDLLDEISRAGDRAVKTEIPADWLQGRAIYGGLSAALCLHTAQTRFADLPPLRSAQLAFIAPAGPGVALVPSILRGCLQNNAPRCPKDQ